MIQILIAVKCMHSAGIVHRDMNPSNVFLHFPPQSQIMSKPSEAQNDAACPSKEIKVEMKQKKDVI